MKSKIFRILLALVMLLSFSFLTAIPAQASDPIGPGELPDWHDVAQVQLGWVFDDPTKPQDSDPIPGWDKAIGDIPVWSYDADGTYGENEQPAQWYIRIPNLNNDNPVKKFWMAWVYEFETLLPGERSATNIGWDPGTGCDNVQRGEVWFDSDGNIIDTGDWENAAYVRVTLSLDMYPNPQYEEIWLGLNGLPGAPTPNAVEVYIKTLCVVGEGRMTGGGSVFDSDNNRVTHGFELNCDINNGPNNLEVNWGKGNKFHLTELDSVLCLDDLSIDEGSPVAGFDTYIGKGKGRYNGEPGATIEFVFTDAGEPGKNDSATIKICDVNGDQVLSVSDKLKNGNHQAHAK